MGRPIRVTLSGTLVVAEAGEENRQGLVVGSPGLDKFEHGKPAPGLGGQTCVPDLAGDAEGLGRRVRVRESNFQLTSLVNCQRIEWRRRRRTRFDLFLYVFFLYFLFSFFMHYYVSALGGRISGIEVFGTDREPR